MNNKIHPNILFLITDQQQQSTINDDSPCMMPNVDSLKKSGVTFVNARTVNAICSPARASLMTARLPHNHGMVDNSHCVEPFRADFVKDQNTVSRQLKSHGYNLGYFGKWHVERSDDPGIFGFNEYSTEYHGLEFRRTIKNPRKVNQRGYNERVLYGVHSEPVTETEEYYFYSRGIEFIDSASKNSDEPWCTFISTNAPHDPYIAPQEMFDLYDPLKIELPESFGDTMEDKPAIYRRLKNVWKDLSKEDYQNAIACYYANCSLVDSQVGRILKYLDESGQRENTMIIFLSDHGDMLGGHGLLCKGVPAFDESYRIPLILSWPGQIPENEVRNSYTSIIDIVPTVLELAGCKAMKRIDGKSMVPIFEKDDILKEKPVYAEFFGQRLSYSQRITWKGPYKYIFNGFDFDELYNLEKDPGEIKNLIDDKAYDSVKIMMAREMWNKARESGDNSLLETEYFMYRFAPVGPELEKKNSIYNRGAYS